MHEQMEIIRVLKDTSGMLKDLEKVLEDWQKRRRLLLQRDSTGKRNAALSRHWSEHS